MIFYFLRLDRVVAGGEGQFLRYAYSMAAGDVRFWNWRRHNNIDGVLRVIDIYSGMAVECGK